MTKKLKMLLGALAVPALTASLNAQTLLGTYEFTDNSLAATDANGADGITLSAFTLTGYTLDEVFSDADATTADPTLDYLSANGSEVGSGSTGTQFSDGSSGGGKYYSFTVTNNSGNDLVFSSLTASFTNEGDINKYYNTRVYNQLYTETGFDVIDNTIGSFGRTPGGPIDDTALLDGTDAGAGTNFSGQTITLATGNAMTFYLPFVAQNTGSDTKRLLIDDVQIYGTIVPEPSSYALLAGLLGLTSVMIRRRK